MNIGELNAKAEFIANRRLYLLKQWRQYSITLVQGITLSKAKLHHTISCEPEDALRFYLFNYFAIQIRLTDDFNPYTIEYIFARRDGSNKVLIASAIIDDEGRIDNVVDIGNREQVLEHYLGLLSPVYDSLYQAIVENKPLSMLLLPYPSVV
jgi:formate hydrogenlyase regulatory protein HycA